MFVRLEAANGTTISQRIPFTTVGPSRKFEMDVLLTDVAKPLAVVPAITHAGDVVSFGKQGVTSRTHGRESGTFSIEARMRLKFGWSLWG